MDTLFAVFHFVAHYWLSIVLIIGILVAVWWVYRDREKLNL